MLRSGHYARALSLAARLCCKEAAEFPVVLQLLQQAHGSIGPWKSLNSKAMYCCGPASRRPAALVQDLLMSYRHWSAVCSTSMHLIHTSNSSRDSSTDKNHFSSSSNGVSNSTNSPQRAAAARPRELALVFTCSKCDTRAAKTFTRQAYEHGLVLITCPGCKAMHLIADHLGWFGDKGFKVDEYLASQGQQVKRLNMTQQGDSSAQVTAEDIVGWSKVQQLLSTVAAAAADSNQSESGQGCCGDGSRHDHGHKDTAQLSPGSNAPTAAAAAAVQEDSLSRESGEAAVNTDEDGDMNASMSQETHHGVVEVAPSDVEAWLRVQQQKQQQAGGH